MSRRLAAVLNSTGTKTFCSWKMQWFASPRIRRRILPRVRSAAGLGELSSQRLERIIGRSKGSIPCSFFFGVVLFKIAWKSSKRA